MALCRSLPTFVYEVGSRRKLITLRGVEDTLSFHQCRVRYALSLIFSYLRTLLRRDDSCDDAECIHHRGTFEPFAVWRPGHVPNDRNPRWEANGMISSCMTAAAAQDDRICKCSDTDTRYVCLAEFVLFLPTLCRIATIAGPTGVAIAMKGLKIIRCDGLTQSLHKLTFVCSSGHPGAPANRPTIPS